MVDITIYFDIVCRLIITKPLSRSSVRNMYLFWLTIFQFKRMLDEYTYGRPEQLDPSSRNLARKVDKISRWLFPGAFFIFCVVYWCVYYLTDRQ